MSLLLWILGYLAVGFVVAVAVHRYWRTFEEGDAGVAAGFVVGWPFLLPVLAYFVADERWRGKSALLAVIRWCARRLP